MLTFRELFYAIALPALVAAAIAIVGRWRRWQWALPLAAGAGFLAGYASFGIPALPPRDGTDWLFWIAILLTGVAIAVAIGRWTWSWALGLSAGPVAWVLLHPLAAAIPPATVWTTIILVTLAGPALLFIVVHAAEPRIGPVAVNAALTMAVGAAAVVVLSSNLRIVGIYGLAAAAALAPVALCSFNVPAAARSIAVLAIPLLTGLLVAGRFYPDPGVTWVSFIVLLASPLLLLAGAFLPTRRPLPRAITAILAVAIAVAAVTIPTALAAKRAAEADPYGDYYR